MNIREAILSKNYKWLIDNESCDDRRKQLISLLMSDKNNKERVAKMNNKEYDRYLQRELKKAEDYLRSGA